MNDLHLYNALDRLLRLRDLSIIQILFSITEDLLHEVSLKPEKSRFLCLHGCSIFSNTLLKVALRISTSVGLAFAFCCTVDDRSYCTTLLLSLIR
jgi:hypothetical protein